MQFVEHELKDCSQFVHAENVGVQIARIMPLAADLPHPSRGQYVLAEEIAHSLLFARVEEE